jgi:superfamily II DNA or RNA helicase
MKYPKIDDTDFNKKITKIYNKYKIPEKKKSFKEICFPHKFKLQEPQKFASQYINPKTQYKGLLIYHKIGAGKTCTAVQIGETWKKKKRVIVVVPASLIGNFKKELRSKCAGNEYLSISDRGKLEELHPTDKDYREIIKVSDKKIEKYYDIYSYNKFIELVERRKMRLDKSILIIDEIQNLVSESGSYYKTLTKLLKRSTNNLRLVLLSATPMFDKPYEIALTMNLLNIPNKIPIGNDFYNTFVNIQDEKTGKIVCNTKNMDKFKEMIKGFVSYYRGAPDYVFPKVTIKYVSCPMSDFQYSAYKKVSNVEKKSTNKKAKKKKELKGTLDSLPNNFFIGSRLVSNIVFPNKRTNEVGYKSLTHNNIKKLKEYSIKFYKIISKIKRCHGKVFIYSSFREYGGIKTLEGILEFFGYKNYLKYGEGPKRFAVWTGDENIQTKDEIRSIYNKKDNLNGNKIKILLGSPAIKEGVTLLAVKEVHIVEPYWNQSRLDQIIGRANRYCSHKDLKKDEREVNIYIYIATHPDEKETTDQYINTMSQRKNKLIREFEKALKEGAVDCRLNYNANNTKNNLIKCV